MSTPNYSKENLEILSSVITNYTESKDKLRKRENQAIVLKDDQTLQEVRAEMSQLEKDTAMLHQAVHDWLLNTQYD